MVQISKLILDKTVKTSVSEICLLDKDLFRIVYKPDSHVEVSHIEEALEVYRDMIGNKRFYLLTVIGPGVTVSLEARNYWSTEERSKMKIGEAIVISGLAHKLMANFVQKLNPPKHKMEIFSTEKKAMDWLNELRKKK